MLYLEGLGSLGDLLLLDEQLVSVELDKVFQLYMLQNAA